MLFKVKLSCFALILYLIPLSAQIRIKAVGDVMLGSNTPEPIIPSDSGKFFKSNIASYLDSADIIFGNLEGVFIKDDLKPVKCSETSRKAHRCYEFGMPNYLSKILEDLHFSIVSLDNNHVSDYGWAAYKYTKSILDGHNIAYAAKKKPIVLNVYNKKIAFIPFGTSSESFHVANVAEAKHIVASFKDSVDIIVVSFHGGAEGAKHMHVKNETEIFYGENRGNLIKFSHGVIDAGADLILGHGPHVLRAMELYKNKLIVFSMGNFLTYGNVKISGVNGKTIIADLIIDSNSGDFIKGQLIPVIQRGRGIPMYDTAGSAIKIIKDLTTFDFNDSILTISSSGKLINTAYVYPEVVIEEEIVPVMDSLPILKENIVVQEPVVSNKKRKKSKKKKVKKNKQKS